MAFLSSNGWESTVTDASEVDGALLMDLLEESPVEDVEDERLGSVMRSLEAEIDTSGTHESGGPSEAQWANFEGSMNYKMEDFVLDNGRDCSMSVCHVDDPFDRVDMEMVWGPHCDVMAHWYLDPYTNEAGMVEFGDVRDYSPFSYEEISIEHEYSPLWQ